LLALFFNTEDGCDMLVRNVSWHGVISQKTETFLLSDSD
jgi:hypothetical protein